MDSAQLESMYNQFNSYILQHFELFWNYIIGGLLVVLVAIGGTLFFVAKSLIKSGIERAAKNALLEMKSLKSEIDDLRQADEKMNKDILELTAIIASYLKDSHEAGKWTPLLVSGEIGTGWGQYIKNSNMVFISGEVYARDIKSDSKGQVYISGFPFPHPPSGLGYDMHLFTISSLQISNNAGPYICEYGCIYTNGLVFLQYQTPKDKSRALLISELSENQKFTINGFYRIADPLPPSIPAPPHKHCCVIDENNNYVEFVLVLLKTDENGKTYEEIQYYTLKQGERLIDAKPPILSGSQKSHWNGTDWE